MKLMLFPWSFCLGQGESTNVETGDFGGLGLGGGDEG